MALSNHDIQRCFAEWESVGAAEVRRRLVQQDFGKGDAPLRQLAEDWLAEHDATFSESSTREANLLARQANMLAREANESVREANALASRANRIAIIAMICKNLDFI